MFKLVLEKAEARGRAVLLGSFTLLLSTWVPEKKKKKRRKGRGTRDHIANISWIIEKAREFQKNIYFCFIDYAKEFVWITIQFSSVAQITINFGKF